MVLVGPGSHALVLCINQWFLFLIHRARRQWTDWGCRTWFRRITTCSLRSSQISNISSYNVSIVYNVKYHWLVFLLLTLCATVQHVRPEQFNMLFIFGFSHVGSLRFQRITWWTRRTCPSSLAQLSCDAPKTWIY